MPGPGGPAYPRHPPSPPYGKRRRDEYVPSHFSPFDCLFNFQWICRCPSPEPLPSSPMPTHLARPDDCEHEFC
jgi:hypothetical protein